MAKHPKQPPEASHTIHIKRLPGKGNGYSVTSVGMLRTSPSLPLTTRCKTNESIIATLSRFRRQFGDPDKFVIHKGIRVIYVGSVAGRYSVTYFNVVGPKSTGKPQIAQCVSMRSVNAAITRFRRQFGEPELIVSDKAIKGISCVAD